MTRQIEIDTTITREVRRGTGLAAQRIDIFEVDCVAVIEYEFEGSRLDWRPIAFRFETRSGNAWETLEPADVFFPALAAALDGDVVTDEIWNKDEDYAAACAAERKADRTDYRVRAL